MTVRRLFSSWATKLAIWFASSSALDREPVSLAAPDCLWLPELRPDFFRALALHDYEVFFDCA
jgi:hypothetical protein